MTRTHLRGLITGLCTATALGSLPALAQDVEKESRAVAGHTVTVIQTEDFMQALEVDGERLREDGLILLDQPLTVAGQPVLTGVSGPGGNACDAAYFVLLLPEGQPARLDGPIDSCATMTVTAQADALVIGSQPLPGIPGEVWTWTPAGGLTEALPEAFTPDAASGWQDLPALSRAHPADALKLKPVYDALVAGLPPADLAAFEAIITGLGSGDTVPQGYRGEACTKVVCEDEYAILWLDAASEGVFAFWVQDGQEPRTYPDGDAQWPEWIQTDLADRLGAAN